MTFITDKIVKNASKYNETEVRYHILDPLLKHLGYPGGDDVYFKLEEELEYPYLHIGRKNKKKDLPLGFPDYRVGLKGRRGCFIVEAKSGKVRLTQADIEQAHSYAAHSQVGASYFLLSNGISLELYETLSGAHANPIVKIEISNLSKRIHELENILTPENLRKNCSVDYDKGLKLCDGLGSAVKIRSGVYSLEGWSYNVLQGGTDITEECRRSAPQFRQIEDQLAMMRDLFELRVEKGSVERDLNGRIVANVKFAGATKNNLAAMKMIGVDQMSFATEAQFVSLTPEDPTIWEATADFAMNRGLMLPQMLGGATTIEQNVDGSIYVSVRLAKMDGEFVGDYRTTSVQVVDLPFVGRIELKYDYFGSVSLHIGD